MVCFLLERHNVNRGVRVVEKKRWKYDFLVLKCTSETNAAWIANLYVFVMVPIDSSLRAELSIYSVVPHWPIVKLWAMNRFCRDRWVHAAGSRSCNPQRNVWNLTYYSDILRPYEIGIRAYYKVGIKYFNPLPYYYITRKRLKMPKGQLAAVNRRGPTEKRQKDKQLSTKYYIEK